MGLVRCYDVPIKPKRLKSHKKQNTWNNNNRMNGVINRHKQDINRRALILVLIIITVKLFQFAYELYAFVKEVQ